MTVVHTYFYTFAIYNEDQEQNTAGCDEQPYVLFLLHFSFILRPTFSALFTCGVLSKERLQRRNSLYVTAVACQAASCHVTVCLQCLVHSVCVCQQTSVSPYLRQGSNHAAFLTLFVCI
jgi:hypothetical protein